VPKVVIQTVIREPAQPKPVARVVAEVPPVMPVAGVKGVATRPVSGTQVSARRIVLDPKTLRQQIVMMEVLSRPVALREEGI
jgi:hypothetical protein